MIVLSVVEREDSKENEGFALPAGPQAGERQGKEKGDEQRRQQITRQTIGAQTKGTQDKYKSSYGSEIITETEADLTRERYEIDKEKDKGNDRHGEQVVEDFPGVQGMESLRSYVSGVNDIKESQGLQILADYRAS